MPVLIETPTTTFSTMATRKIKTLIAKTVLTTHGKSSSSSSSSPSSLLVVVVVSVSVTPLVVCRML